MRRSRERRPIGSPHISDHSCAGHGLKRSAFAYLQAVKSSQTTSECYGTLWTSQDLPH